MIFNEASYKTFSHTGVNGRIADIKPFPFKGDFKGISPAITGYAELFGKSLVVSDKDEHILTDYKGTIDIIAEENKIVTAYFRIKGKSNIFFRIKTMENSNLNLIILEEGEESFKSIAIEEEANSKASILIFELGKNLQITNLQCDLSGEESAIEVNGIYFDDYKGDMDFSYHVRHFGEKTNSLIRLDGALKEGAKKIVKSNLDFYEGSKGAVGNESESSILLSDNVINKSVPILLSHEDDVEGNHAQSTGKIDEAIKFYLMSRGFSEEEAESLILRARFEETIMRVQDGDKREYIREKIDEIARS